jgi:hypothetical protein
MIRGTINCPYCNDEVNENEGFTIGNTITCPRNNHSFNKFTIYRTLYQEVPLAAGIGNKLADAIYRSAVPIGSSTDVQTITSYFQQQEFEALLHRIVLDTVIYGASFLENDNTQLRRIDLAEADLRVGPTQRGGGRAYTVDLVTLTWASRTIDLNKLIEFEHRASSEHFMGSAYGEWYSSFKTVGESSQARVNASIMKAEGIDDEGLGHVLQISDYFANQVLEGAGLHGYNPRDISDPSFNLDSLNWELRMTVEGRRSEIRESIEREIFPLALSRPWTPRNYPTLEILGA